jgi:hypothetical protein
MKTLTILLFTLLLTACGNNFVFPPDPPSPVYIHIRDQHDITSSMPLDRSTVANVVATHVTNGKAALRFSLTGRGAKALYNISATNIGQILQVIWQDDVISSNRLQSPLGGSTMTLVLVLPDSTPNEIQGMINSIKGTGKKT